MDDELSELEKEEFMNFCKYIFLRGVRSQIGLYKHKEHDDIWLRDEAYQKALEFLELEE